MKRGNFNKKFIEGRFYFTFLFLKNEKENNLEKLIVFFFLVS